MAISVANISQCQIENEAIIATFARVQASRVSSFRYFVGYRSQRVHRCLEFTTPTCLPPKADSARTSPG
jgi:hypothetical protein